MPKTSLKSNSKTTFFTVGPSQIYSTVPAHMENAIRQNVWSMSHRGSDFKELYKSMTTGLRKLLKIPANYEIVVLSSALEAMERVIQSMSHNNTYHILSGFFGVNGMTIAKELSKSPESFQFFNWDKNQIYDKGLENLKIPKKSELVCITQNDTSVGFSIPMNEIYALTKKNPDKLFALDIVSSVPYIDIEYKYLDAVFFSVQKGFGLPAGLSVLILSPKALKKAEKLSKIKGYSIGSYQDKIEIKGGKKETVKEKIFPGYILIKMELSDLSWLAVRTTQGVTSFIGAGNKPTPISEAEVATIVKFTTQGASPTFKDVFMIDDTVKIVDGPFAEFIGKVDSVDKEKGRVRVLVSIFGRETPVELDFLQVQKL